MYDHFKLEIVRLRYINKIKETYENSLNKAKKEIAGYQKSQEEYKNDIKEQSEIVKNLTKEIEDRYNKSTSQSMTVLGIFSAIVFAFTGGFGIIGTTFNNGINTVYRMRFIFTILLLCFSLFNIVMGLLISLFKLSDNSISFKCKYSDKCENCKKNHKESDSHCNQLLKFMRKYPLMFWINIILIFGMAITFVIWIIQNKT